MNQCATCPFCEAEINMLSDTVKDELLECNDCGSELVVVGVEPFMVEEAPRVEEDWGQ